MNRNSTLKGLRIARKNCRGLLRPVVVIFAVFFLFQAQAQNSSLTIKDIIKDVPGIPAVAVSPQTTIGDLVWMDNDNNGIQDTNEPGVPNIMVVLYDSALNTLDTRYTDKNGHYLFDHVPVPVAGERSFRVGFYNIPPNYTYTKLVPEANGATSGSKADPINWKTKLFNVRAGESYNNIDAGIKSAPGIILPLTIDQFNGIFSNGYVQLKWTTFTEINVDHFEIERSFDQKDFETIAMLMTPEEDFISDGIFRYKDNSKELSPAIHP